MAQVDRSGGRRLSPRLSVAALSGCVATGLCYWAMVHTESGHRIDMAAFGGALRPGALRLGFLDPLLKQVDAKGLLVAMILLLGIGVARRRPLVGAAAALAAGLPVVAVEGLRSWVLDRAPFAVKHTFGDSYPSGHVTTVVAVVMALLLVCPPRWRARAALLGSVLAVAAGDQVQVLGWHRPSDVIGGSFLAYAAVCGISAALAWLRPLGKDAAPFRSMWMLMSAVGVAAAMLAAFATADGLITTGAVLSVAVQRQIYLVDLGVIIGVVAVLMATLTLMLGDVELGAGFLPVRYSSERAASTEKLVEY